MRQFSRYRQQTEEDLPAEIRHARLVAFNSPVLDWIVSMALLLHFKRAQRLSGECRKSFATCGFIPTLCRPIQLLHGEVLLAAVDS